MQTYNTSVSPPFGARQSFQRPGHEDRDDIKRRAAPDFPKLYADHGGRCRGKMWHCLFHDDRTPSASIRNGRFRCFTCDISLDVIEFVQRIQGTDFKGALAYLGDRYGVPLQPWRLPPADRARYAQQQRDLERDLPAALHWKRIALQIAEAVLAKLKAPLADPRRGPADPDGILRLERFLRRLRPLHGLGLVDEYRRWVAESPQLTAGMVHVGEMRAGADVRAGEACWELLGY